MKELYTAIAWTIVVLSITFIVLVITTDWKAHKKCELRKSRGECIAIFR